MACMAPLQSFDSSKNHGLATSPATDTVEWIRPFARYCSTTAETRGTFCSMAAVLFQLS